MGGPTLVQAAKKWRSSPGILSRGGGGGGGGNGAWQVGEALHIELTNPLQPAVQVTPGSTVVIQTSAGDRDLSPDDHLVEDALHYNWSDVHVGSITQGGPAGVWTIPANVSVGATDSVTITASDDGTTQFNDDDKSVTVNIEVVAPKVWTAGVGMGVGFDEPTAGREVFPGDTVHLSAHGTDSDHWTQGAASGDSPDDVKPAWSNTPGLSHDGWSGTWTAPAEPGTYTITVTGSDDDTQQFDDSPNKSATLTFTVPAKVWTAGDPIRVDFENPPAALTVHPGQVVTLTSTHSDSDHWRQADHEGNSPDTLTPSWDPVEGLAPDGWGATWTAPDTPGDYTVKLRASDNGTDQFDDDEEHAFTSITFTVAPKVWSAGDPIDVHFDNPPQNLVVHPGQIVSLSTIHSDSDHWEQADLHGDQADDLHPTWTPVDGLEADGWGATWTAPQAPGDYAVTITASDDGTTQFDDAPNGTATLTFTVPPKVWTIGSVMQVFIDGPSAGGTVYPGDVVHLHARAEDYDHWQQGDQQGDEEDAAVENPQWSGAPGLVANEWEATWTVPNTPGHYTVTFTADNGGTDKYADPQANDTMEFEVPEKVWTVGGPITVSISGNPGGSVTPGTRVQLNASGADSDHWTQGERSGDEDDKPLHYAWSVSPSRAGTISWTAPDTPGEYTIGVTANDNGTSRFGDGNSPESTVTITVAPADVWTWSPDPLVQAGALTSSAGVVHPNGLIVIDAPREIDWDKRTNQGGETVYEKSGLCTYHWSGGGDGSLLVQDGPSAVWAAPSAVGPNGEDVTITCIKDDNLDGQTGVEAPDEGTRDDPPTGPMSITIHIAPTGCGDWHHDHWDEAAGIVWRDDTGGDPEPIVPTAVEHVKWVDNCDATDVRDPRQEDRRYRKMADHTVVIEGVPYREVSYQAFSGYHGPPTAVLTDKRPYVRHWVSSPGLSGGEISPLAPNTVLGPEETLTVGVNAVTDWDSWTQGPLHDTAKDGVRYVWSSGGIGSFPGGNTGQSATWKAPAEADIPAGPDGLSVTLTCTIDDSWDDGQNGVTAPDTGDRSDDPLPPRSVTFKVLRAPCGRWMHKSWAPGRGVTWRTDANGDPVPVDPPWAKETLKWVDDCAGTTKADVVQDVPYTLGPDGPVQEDGVWYRKVEYRAYSSFPDAPPCPESGPLTSMHVLPKHWSLPAPLEAGTLSSTVTGSSVPISVPVATENTPSSVAIPQGTGLNLLVEGAKDSDTYSYWGNVGEQTEEESIRGTWYSSKDGAERQQIGSGLGLNWTPSQPGSYVLTVEVDDPWSGTEKGVTEPDRGDRNDGFQTLCAVVRVTAKNWETRLPLGKKPRIEDGAEQFDGDGNLLTDDTGRMLAPQDQRTVLPDQNGETAHILLAVGDTLPCQVEETQDWDFWRQDISGKPENLKALQQALPYQGWAQDTVKYHWSAIPPVPGGGTGTFADPASPSTSWIPPAVAGTYTLVCQLDDSVDEGNGVTAPDAGDRNDGPLLRQVKVDVYHHKEWDTFKPIGWKPVVGDDGQTTWTEDGRITAPQNQAAGDTHLVRVAPGANVNCAIEDATDVDRWTKGPEGDTDFDEVNYVWTASRGKFLVTSSHVDGNGNPTTGLETFAYGKTAVWVAPTDVENSTDVEISCTVSDRPKPIDADDIPSRDDDEDLIRSVNVTVVSGTPSAQIVLLKQDRDGRWVSAPSGSTIGDNVKVGLSIEVPPGYRVAASAGEADVSVKEDEDTRLGGDQHPETKNHIELPFNLGGSWDQWSDPAPVVENGVTTDLPPGWYPAGSPKSSNDGTDTQVYRTLLNWDTRGQTSDDPDGDGPLTASTLLGHNWEHSIRLSSVDHDPAHNSITFEKVDEQGNWAPAVQVTPEVFRVDVRNLVIENVATSSANLDYVILDKSSPQASLANPTVSFRVSDDGCPHRYRWRVRARKLSSEAWDGVLIQGELEKPGPVVARINVPDNGLQKQTDNTGTQPATLTEDGLYTFDVEVEEINNNGDLLGVNGDRQTYRSPVACPNTIPGGVVDAQGHSVPGNEGIVRKDANGDFGYFVNYYIDDESENLPLDAKATSLYVQLLNWDFSQVVAENDNSWERQLNVPVLDKKLTATDLKPGEYTATFSAVDSHAPNYRDHENRRTLAYGGRTFFARPEDAIQVQVDRSPSGVNRDWMVLNRGRDEENVTADDLELEDYQVNDRIVPDDEELVPGKIAISPTIPLSWKWSLSFPDKVLVWRKLANGNYEKLIPGRAYDIPTSRGVDVYLEGIAVSEQGDDVSLVPSLQVRSRTRSGSPVNLTISDPGVPGDGAETQDDDPEILDKVYDYNPDTVFEVPGPDFWQDVTW